MNKESLAVNFKLFNRDFKENQVISVPLVLFNLLKNCLSPQLKLGSLELKVICIPNFTSNTIELTPYLMESLGFSEDTSCHAMIWEDQISLGPVIGVFTSNGSVRRAHEETANFRTLALGRANGIAETILYFFTIKDVDFINKRINGTYYDLKTDSWEKKLFPLPDILYDRGGGALKSQKSVSNYIRKQLNSDGYLKINPQHYFDKWDVHKNLMNYEKVAKYLPKSILYQDSGDIRSMLSHSSILYIKDCLGSNGRGVMRIIKLPHHGFEYSYYADDTVVEKRIQTIDELIVVIEQFFRKKKTIVQNAINVIKINQSSVDLRATVQRNGKGALTITAYPVRIGKSKSPITSTKSGSSVYRFEDFFETYFNYTQDELKNLKEKINEFLIDVYTSIEDIYGTFGEIGIDFAIDQEGLIWFIECNAKPGKDTLYFSYGEHVVEKAFLNPLEYGKYLWRLK